MLLQPLQINTFSINYMTTSNSSSRKLRVKLLIDTEDQKVLFAEAGKDFVDFLFGLLSLPIRTIINLVSKDDDAMVGSCSKDAMVGSSKDAIFACLAKLYKIRVDKNSDDDSYKDDMVGCLAKLHKGTIENFSDSCMQRNVKKDMLLNPTASIVAGVPDILGLLTNGRGGYVKDHITYMIQDDLKVGSLSYLTGIVLISRSKINVGVPGSLEERIVTLYMDEVIKLSKALLQSKSSILTDAFLGKNSA